MPRGVDNVELVALPEAGGGGGLNGDTTLSFLFHEVHGGSAVVYFTDFVDFSGKFEDTFGSGSFAGVHVGENADVAIFAEVLHGVFWNEVDGA